MLLRNVQGLLAGLILAISHTLSLAATPGCTPVDLVPPVDGRDICYGTASWSEPTLGGATLVQTFDFVRPSGIDTTSAVPLIIWAHPNGMSKTLLRSSETYKALVPPALAAGFAVASVEFRHPVVNEEPNNSNPAPHLDLARAIQYIRANAAALAIDPLNIFVVGQSRGTLALWTVLQDDMADPSSPDRVAQQSTRANAAWMINAQTTYDGHEFSELFIVPRDRPTFNAAFDARHPKHAEFGSAIKSVNAGLQPDPPVVLRYDSPVVPKLLTIEELADYDVLHYPNFGVALCGAYQVAFGNTTRCIYQADIVYKDNPAAALQGYVKFFQRFLR